MNSINNILCLSGFFLYFFFSSFQIIFYKYPNINLIGFILFLVLVIWRKNYLLKIPGHLCHAVIILNIWLTFNAIFSAAILHHSLYHICKFYIILIMLNFIFLFNSNEYFTKLLILTGFLQAIFICGFEIYMWLNWSMYDYKPIRDWIGTELKIGDVYTRNGWFWNIQLAGNSIMPVAFFCSIVQKSRNIYFKIFYTSVLLAGSIFSGNLAFWIAIFIFLILLVNNFRNILFKKIFFLFAGLLLVFVFHSRSFNALLTIKNESSVVKYEQVEVILNTLKQPSLKSILFGIGLGGLIELETENRDYFEARWYELQFLFAATQIGIFCFLFFLLVHLKLISQFLNKNQQIVYGSYILYALSNPYSFDSSHVLIIFAIAGLNKA